MLYLTQTRLWHIFVWRFKISVPKKVAAEEARYPCPS